MDIAEFTIFLMFQIFLLVYGIQKKAIVLNVIGIITALFLMPFTITNLTVEYVYYVNSTGSLIGVNSYADATTICIIFILLILLHFVVIMREWKS